MIFSEEKCRTQRMNEVVRLAHNADNGFRKIKMAATILLVPPFLTLVEEGETEVELLGGGFWEVP
jgi:hypothetical protein